MNPVSTPRVHTRASTPRLSLPTRTIYPITLSRQSYGPMTSSHTRGEHTPGYTRARVLRIPRAQETTETHTSENDKDSDKPSLRQFFVFNFYFLVSLT